MHQRCLLTSELHCEFYKELHTYIIGSAIKTWEPCTRSRHPFTLQSRPHANRDNLTHAMSQRGPCNSCREDGSSQLFLFLH